MATRTPFQDAEEEIGGTTGTSTVEPVLNFHVFLPQSYQCSWTNIRRIQIINFLVFDVKRILHNYDFLRPTFSPLSTINLKLCNRKFKIDLHVSAFRYIFVIYIGVRESIMSALTSSVSAFFNLATHTYTPLASMQTNYCWHLVRVGGTVHYPRSIHFYMGTILYCLYHYPVVW